MGRCLVWIPIFYGEKFSVDTACWEMLSSDTFCGEMFSVDALCRAV